LEIKTIAIVGIFLMIFSNQILAGANNKIIVLGGGIIGVTSAYYLAESGYDVTVVEQQDDVAQASSFANGAQLCYSCIYPLCHQSIYAALWTRLSTLQLSSWAFLNSRFIQRIENYLFEKALNRELTAYRNKLFKQSALEFNALVKKLNLSFPYQTTGVLQLFFTEMDFIRAKKSAIYKVQHGVQLEILSPQECLHQEPSLRFNQQDLRGGILMQHDGIGDAHLFTKALAQACCELGVKFLLNTEVEKFTFAGNHINGLITKHKQSLNADAFVVCLGVNSQPLLAQLAIDLDINVIKGYSISIDLEDSDELPTIGIADPSHEIFYARLANSFRVAGLTELAGMDTTLKPEKIEILLDAVNNLFPNLQVKAKERAGMVHKWACLRPSSVTKTPLIMRSKFNNLFINTGHGGYGWTLAPASGKLLAELVKNTIVG